MVTSIGCRMDDQFLDYIESETSHITILVKVVLGEGGDQYL